MGGMAVFSSCFVIIRYLIVLGNMSGGKGGHVGVDARG